ncbi:28048_t:CDS:2, partial [Racocetra persica]
TTSGRTGPETPSDRPVQGTFPHPPPQPTNQSQILPKRPRKADGAKSQTRQPGLILAT